MRIFLQIFGYLLNLCILLQSAESSNNTYAAQFTSYFDSPGERTFICPQDWEARGPDCFRVYDTALSWDQAADTCANMGSSLLEIQYLDVSISLGEHLKDSAYWIGYQYPDHWDLPSAANWGDGLPNTDRDHCVKLMNDKEALYPWHMHPCSKPLPFVCRMEGWLHGQFHCLNGKNILDNYTCDEENDCGDGSDELDCEDNDRYFMRFGSQSSIEIRSPGYSGFYRHKQDVVWVLEGPAGSRLMLEFTEFKTESTDFVDVYVGGSVWERCEFAVSLSGDLDNVLPILSTNNYMLVRFTSDNGGSSASSYRFKATCSIAEDYSSSPVELTATPSEKTLDFPGNSQSYPTFTKATWRITADSQWDLVTVMIDSLNLGKEDKLIIYSGDTSDEKNILWTQEDQKLYTAVTSGGQSVTVKLNAAFGGQSFKLRYVTGCSFELNQQSGEIRSPGSVLSGYPSLQTCQWSLKNPNMTVRTKNFTLDSDGDYLKIYEGSDTSGPLLMTYNQSFNDGEFSPVSASSGMFIEFKTDHKTTDPAGHFVLEFSIGCEDPVFQADTVTSGFSTNYLSEFSVSCGSGYYFAQQEFGQCGGNGVAAGSNVTLSCGFGGHWNVRRLPQCQRVYCGAVKDVDNGLVVNITGFVFESEVRYGCFDGFEMSPADGAVVKCEADGDWGDPPLCTAATCTALNANDVTNGDYNYTNSGSNNFGSVVEIMCEEGYDLTEGQLIIHCNKTGHWTGPTEATCTKLYCPVPNPTAHGTLDISEEAVKFDTMVTLTCDSGYSFFNSSMNSIQLRCQPNQTLEAMPECVDMDECADNTTCAYMCHNTEGSYYCTCADGYRVSGANCVDIDECDENTDGCEDTCTNNDGGYECSCTEEGTELFTINGQNGFYIDNGESILLTGDLLRINHSCISIVCEDPLNGTDVGNGTVLLYKKDYFYVGDRMEFYCDLGYGIKGVNVDDGPEKTSITCQSNSTWSGDVPECEVISCDPLDISGLTNPPQLIPDAGEAIPFGESVTMMCTVEGADPTEFNRTRTCLYDVTEKKYALIGDPLECGVIDCGKPEDQDLPGLEDNLAVNTTFNSTFNFTCKAGFDLMPNDADTIVRCKSNGRWDLRDLRCSGSQCEDPGRPPDGSAKVTSFEEGQVVIFSCEREGFEPSPHNMTCTSFDNSGTPAVEWRDNDGVNHPNISCVDTEPPVITNCPKRTKYLAKYGTIGLTIEATDNSEALQNKTSDPRLDVPIGFNVTVTWTVEDHAGNIAECVFNVTVIDTPPSFPNGCPDAIKIQLNTTASRTIDVSDYISRAESGIVGFEVHNTITPQTITVDGDDLYKPISITQTAEDEVGNMATCIFQAVAVPGPCATWSFQRDEDENSNVNFSNGDKTATVTCVLGYSFFGKETNSLMYTCNDNGDFVDSDQDAYVPHCVESTEAEYDMDIKITYVAASGQTLDLNTNLRDAYTQSFKDNVAQGIATELSNIDECRDNSVTVSLGSEVDNSLTAGSQLIVQVPVLFSGSDSLKVSKCFPFVKISLYGATDILDEDAHDIELSGQQKLKAENADESGRFINDGFICEAGEIQQTEDVNGEDYTRCVPCPPGYYRDGQTCAKCPRGMYQDGVAQTECKLCPNDTSTYNEGATNIDLCYELCSSPLVSDTGLAPCTACRAGTYWVDATTCQDCTSGQTDGAQGAASIDLCSEPCLAGYYSANGYGPNCQPCPVGYYSESNTSTECTACAADMVTLKGANSSADCQDDTAACVGYTCENGGTCTVQMRKVICDCPSGYTGDTCEEDIDYCASKPCYYGATCRNFPDGYNCTCAPISVIYMEASADTHISSVDYYNSFEEASLNNCSTNCTEDSKCAQALYRVDLSKCYLFSQVYATTVSPGNTVFLKVFNNTIKSYSGDRCEIEPNDCPESPTDEGYCTNGGCQDLRNDFQCLCNTVDGFSGPSCSERTEVCTGEVCKNGGTCEADGSIRHTCYCVDGYTGLNCEENIDDCDPDPCLYGGNCTDRVNGFTCECPPLFTGDRCQTRPDDLCAEKPCEDGSNEVGMCVEDYINSAPLCVCQAGYTSEQYSTIWYNKNTPSLTGEKETVTDHGDVCDGNDIIDVKCREVDSGNVHGIGINQTLNCSAEVPGLSCSHDDQTAGNCSDYEVQYICKMNGQSCRKIDECVEEKCMNIESCTDLDNDYRCNCKDGFKGFHCEIDIDECEVDPCRHGGRCDDQVNGYICHCPNGYTGQTCETNIKDCDSKPCENDANCDDLVNDYKCNCQPGYTGKNCSEDIDECLSFPCYHGANCTHSINDFSCQCPPGYTGKRCEDIVTVCQKGLCKNDATCYEIFLDYFCDCNLGFAGDDCSEGESVCDAASPCLNGGVCEISETGIKCKNCPSDYTGAGCECQKDYCNDENICNNQGECTVQSLGSYSCECDEGFTGDHCETEFNFCSGVNCNGGTCVNGADAAVCICPYGKEGDRCDKGIYRDFDLGFSGMGEVTLQHPFFLNTTEVSLAFWVRFTSETGTFLQIQKHDSFTGEAGQTVLNVNESFVLASFGEDITDITEISPDSTYSDGKWHSVVMTYDITASKLKVSVDVINKEVSVTSPSGGRAEDYLSVTLGGEMFSGQISFLQMWDRILTSSEVQELYNKANQDVTDTLKDSLVLDYGWSSYTTGYGTYRNNEGSKRGLVICDNGEIYDDEARKCTVKTDKIPPSLKACPSGNLTKVVAEGQRSVTFEDVDAWDEQNLFEDAQAHTNFRKTETFGPGRYDVVAVAFDDAKNTAICRFSAIVALAGCDHVIPDGRDLSGGVTCNNNQRLVVPLPAMGPACFAAGVYNIFAPLTAYRVPECGDAEESSEKTVNFQWTYEFCSLNLNADSHVPVIETKLKEKLQAFRDSLGVTCSNDCSDDLVIQLSDSVNNRANVQVNNFLTSAMYDGASIETIVRRAVLQDNTFTLTGVCADPSTVISSTFSIESELYCSGNKTEADGLCVTCPAGTAYNSSQKSCDWAPVGYYQNQAGQATFEICPDNTTTETYGSTSQNDCYDICNPGYKYGDSACESCGIGFYQPMKGQRFCFPCEVGSTTYGNNSVSEDDCVDLCGDGQQLMPNNECENCPIGYFRQRGESIKCTKCPDDKYVTASTGSVYKEDCNVRICPAGQFVVNDGCVECPAHSYRTVDMDNCTSCPDSHRTNTSGADSIDDCEFFCEAGSYISNHTGKLTCVLCERDTYKEVTDYYVEVCQNCSSDRPRTSGKGSTSEEDCKFGWCTAGEQVNPNNLTDCLKCDYNTYQDNPDPVYLVDNCTQCPDDKGTQVQGANSSELCMTACPSGHVMADGGNCEPCPRGYFKDNDKGPEFTFGQCERCPEEFITAGTGATSVDQCNVENCTLGEYIDNDGKCQPCAIGRYQDMKWQNACKECVPAESSTADTGSTSLANCSVFRDVKRVMCKMTFDIQFTIELTNPESPTYIALEIRILNNYRLSLTARGILFVNVYLTGFTSGSVESNVETILNETVADPGPAVEDAILTAVSGGTFDPELNPRETVDAQETYTVCEPGTYNDFLTSGISNPCKPCPIGQYQPLARAGLCLPCPDNKTTDQEGTVNEADCVRSCPAGQQSLDNDVCTACVTGSVKPDEGTGMCEVCETGGTYGDDRTVCRVSCKAGTFSVADGSSCDDCPVSQYNPDTDQTSCMPCPDNGTTAAIRSLSADDCKNPCLAIADYCGTGTCVCDGGDCAATFKVTCKCGEFYSGDRCQSRRDPSQESNGNTVIIGSVVGAVVAVILLVSLFAYCYKTRKSLEKPKKYKKRGYGKVNADFEMTNPIHPNGGYAAGGYPGYATSNLGFWPNSTYSPAMGYYPNYTPEVHYPTGYYDNTPRIQSYETGPLQENGEDDFFDAQRSGSLANSPYTMQAFFQRS